MDGDMKICPHYKLSEFLQDHKEIKNLMFGNGLCLDHPILGKAFRFDQESAFALISKVVLYLGKREMPQIRDLKCPEKFLRLFNWTISKEAIIYYIEHLEKEMKNFLQEKSNDIEYQNLWQAYTEINKNYKLIALQNANIENIFTINYDPTLYFAMLEFMSSDNNGGKKVVDGFKGDQYIDAEAIIRRLESEQSRKLYYLHGAHFIMQDKNCELFKKLDPNKISPKKILYDKNSTDNEVPFLIFEQRWRMKKMNIECNKYFSYCREKLLDSKGDILIYGASFENDAHIIEMLLDYIRPGIFSSLYGDRKIYITYVESEENAKQYNYSNRPSKLIVKKAKERLKKYLCNQHNKLKTMKENDFNDLLKKLERLIQDVQIAPCDKEGESITGLVWEKV